MPFRLLLGTLLVMAPALAHALGLGKLKVHSMLHEPLNAEIEFTSITPQELKSLNTKLASRGDFEAAGIERLPHLSNIGFTVAKRLDGTYFLQLNTNQPLREPFLHLLVQVEWAGGRLLREYTALIDPPFQTAGKPSGVTVPRTVPPPPAAEKLPLAQAPVLPVPMLKADVKPVTPPVEQAKPAPAKPAVQPVEKQEVPPQEKAVAAVTPAPVAEHVLGPQDMYPTIIISEVTGWPVEMDEIASPVVEPLGPLETAVEEGVDEGIPAPAAPASYTVKKGDTLWEIAQKVRSGKEQSAEQTIMAIFTANPEAFFRNNVNNLKAGKILMLPERAEVETVSKVSARKEFRAQYNTWQEYKLRLAGASQAIKVVDAAPAPAPEAKAAAPKATETPKPADKVAAVKPGPKAEVKPEAKPEAKKAAKPEQPPKSVAAPVAPKSSEDLLKIVRGTLDEEKAKEKKIAGGEPTETAKTEREALAEKVTALEESLDSKQMETKELGEKVGQVKEQIEKQRRLIELESQQLAQAQQEAAGEKGKQAAQAEKPAAAPPVKGPEQKAEAAPAKPPAAAATVTPEKKPRVARKKVLPPPPPVEEPSFFDAVTDILGGQVLLIVLAIIAVAGGGILLVYMRRRQKSVAEFQESVLTTSELVTNESVTGTTTAGDIGEETLTTGDTSFLTDFSQEGMGNIHTDEVDPIAEAEVYLAYGRDEQAEEILKEAVVKDPARQELRVKLLEIYNQRNDVKAFETLAEELYASLEGKGGEIWAKVEEMGRKLNPENPMFRGGAATKVGSRFEDTPPMGDITAPEAKPEEAPHEMLGSAMAGAETESVVEEPEAPKAAAGGVDFDMDIDFPEKAATSPGKQASSREEQEMEPMAQGGESAIDYGIVDESVKEAENLVPEAPEVRAEGAGGDIEWDMGEQTPEAGDEVMLETHEEAPTAETPPISDDITAEQWDETATKLDLAKAYIDMGDAEGARSILDEVMVEGNDDQKTQAAELAKQIA